MTILFSYLGGLFLGWSVGTNDSANMFGTAVASRMVKYRTAVLLIAVFVTVGAYLQGHAGMKTVSDLAASKNVPEATAQTEPAGKGALTTDQKVLISCTFAAAVAMTMMSWLKIPVSSSQMMIGAVIGVGLVRRSAEWGPIAKVVACWVLNPFGAMMISAFLYWLLALPIRKWKPEVFILDPILRLGLIVCGCYGAYALGANGVGIVSVVFAGDAEGLISNLPLAAALGGAFIGLGAITFSRPVMMTVGKGIVPLDAYTAFIAVLSLAVTVHIFAILGVPVSTSQSIIGGLLGIGLIKGLHIVNRKMLTRVVVWWVVSPFISAAISIMLYFLFIVR